MLKKKQTNNVLLLYLFIKLCFLFIQARLFLGFTTLRKGGCELQLKKMWYTSKKYKRKIKNVKKYSLSI